MTEKELRERASIKLEIEARKEVLKKVENAFKRLRKQADSNLEKRREKVRAAREYRSLDEAHEAWGYDFITDEEFEEIKKVFELGDAYIENNLSPQEVAVNILGRFIGGLNKEIRSFEFELLPIEEQERIRKQKLN